MHQKEILAALTQNIAELCSMNSSEVDSTVPFVEMGLDSLMLTKLTQFIQDSFGVAVEPRQLFEEAASLEALTELIAHRAPAPPAPEPAVEARSAMPRPFAPTPAGQAVPPRTSVLSAAGTPAVFEESSPLQRLFAQQLQLMAQQLQILQKQEGPANSDPPTGQDHRGSIEAARPTSAHPADGVARRTVPPPQVAPPQVTAPRQATVPQPPPDVNRPALSQIVGHVLRLQVEDNLSTDLEHYAELVPEMEELSVLYILEAFVRMGWQARTGQTTSTAELAASLGVASRYHRLFGRLLEMLAEAGYVMPAGNGWEVRRELAAGSTAAQVTDLRQRFPSGEIELSVLDRCGRKLPEVLRGQCDPLTLLFAADGPDVTQMYESAPAAKLLNSLAGQAVAEELAQWPADRMVRILEVGAGTGGTTASVLPQLPKDRTDYVFTDVSPAFLARARKKFSGYPFARYLRLDIEDDPCQQGFEPAQFDLVLVANVLHATRDLRQSLAHVRKLLAPHGLLVMLENVGRQRWADLTVGLTDGWWRFSDTEVRPDYPLVGEDTWRSLLQSVGFAETTDALCALERDRSDGVRHPLILARASGPEESRGDISQMAGWFRLPEVQTKKLSTRQRAHLEKLSARYITRTQLSKRLTERYRPKLADNRALFGFRMNTKEMLYPIYAARSQGARIEDIDGNEYIDLTMGFGVNLFGHRPPFVQAALEEQLQLGIQIGPQSALAGEVAELISEITGNERINFCNTGTEAVMVAMRVARTATKREIIVIFQRGFHGTSDGVLAMGVVEDGRHCSRPKWAGVTPGHVQEVMVLEFDDPRSLEIIEANFDQIAAVMVEPVQSSNPQHQAGAFLRELRRVTLEKGIVLIFDEMVTGFRLHPNGAQGWFDVQADLVAYGKLIGGGMPLSVVAGKAEYLDRIDGGRWQYGDASYPQVQPTFTGGTYSKHPLALAASRAVLQHLKKEGPGLQQTLNRRTDQLAARVNSFFEDQEVPGKLANCGSMMRFMFSQDMELFFYHLSNKGVYIWEGRGCFISTAHTEDDVEQVVQAIKESIFEMREGEFLPSLELKGRPPVKAAVPNCLGKLREKGTKPPLFFAPGVYGTSWYLSNLVRCIDKEQPVYGLQARGLRDGEVPHDSIEGMAREFVEAIRTVLPNGPYLLAGHSTGAVVALETALQLQRLGQAVDFLAILDNPPFQKDNPMTEEHCHYDDARWMDKFALGINPTSETKLAPHGELIAMSPEELWNAFADWLRAAGQLSRDAPTSQARNVLEVFKVSAVAELVYRPRELYRGTITLFRAADAMGRLYESAENAAGLAAAAGHDDPTMFWSEVSSQPVEVVPVPGDHLSMVFEPHCQTLAQRLTAALARHQEKSGSPTLALAAT